MAIAVLARRAITRSRFSSPSFLRVLASSPISPFLRVSEWSFSQSISRLPIELDCARSLMLLRNASNSAVERIDGEFDQDPNSRKRGEGVEAFGRISNDHRGYGNVGNIQPHHHPTGFNKEKNTGVQLVQNGNYGYNGGQHYQTANSYYNSSSNVPNNQQSINRERSTNGYSGNYQEQTYWGTHGYNRENPRSVIPNHRQSFSGENTDGRHYGCNHGQPYENPDGNNGNNPSNQPSFSGERTIDTYERSETFYSEKPSVFQYNYQAGFQTATTGQPYHNQSGAYKENNAGFDQGPNVKYGDNTGNTYPNPNIYNSTKPRGDIPSNQLGFSGETTTDIYQSPQEPTWCNGVNPLPAQQNNIPFQSGIDYPLPMATSQTNEMSFSGGSPENVETSGYKGTVDELDEFCKDNKVKEAVEVLDLLEKNGVVVDLPRYFRLMQACGEASSLEEAKKIHDHISRIMVNVEVGVHNKILEMYTKCGSMDDAIKLFESMPQRNLTSWDTMILGFANNGLGEEALDLFSEFKQLGLKPDSYMFVNVFFACGVLGAVDEGMLHFESMQKDFGINPKIEHYVSIVDMLGRSGYLEEALEFIEQMPVEPSVDVWETLMNLCRVNGNLELGDRCAEIVERLDPSKLNEQAKLGLLPVKASDLAKEKERKKANLLEVRNRVHEYRAGDRSHPEHEKIYHQLRCLSAQMKEAGYIPDTRFVLHDIDQESKEEALLAHSERLAIGYGLMTSGARSPIRIIKNLRACGDCHTALKIISKLVGRQLIVRDAKRFHHFENGVCSCKDYW
ncbi:pentatricopeptide repeat-containing protein At4g32450, mitochondrial-like [Ananas comosus]|uniref:Pentatricopeptide repeat-containing protein At4g32450, mitochondrial-like n=1 Tax=Ananas comosus TaxID=4615 RepID=A0A6P5GA78_ANACO|nr:pentatricopeptide repeat-containing protein At4g32450, mitochondrial-like [Ananas comosus]XP_020105531.1 pentatricopeptide repeat-containing protein At4g32450, mitochondrial-like [Ananas comosus]XP_020105533.1 pentatricopeptide repeat-containing protein At4g32450, mitochondrial-like [Ananas comosus]